ncbi:MAG: YSC84-related protein [Thermodesulfobacteriota bacterium]|nr:YSC84-related protein [Thermodesulfobacteriota bacterium]
MKEWIGTFRNGRTRYALFGILGAILLATIPAGVSYAKSPREIDTSVDVCLERFYKQVKGAKEFAREAKGLLVMPNVVKAGFFVGGKYGEGALRVGGKTAGYYNLIGGSYGLTFGAQSQDIIIAFMTDEALKKFRESAGWEAGVDANVAMIALGAGGDLSTTTVKDPVVGFVFGTKGLMADVSLKGAKFTKLEK